MRTREPGKPYRTLTTLKTVLIGIPILALGIVCMYVSGLHFLQDNPGVQALLDHLGAAFVISVGLGAVWELIGKRAFALEVLERANMSSDVATFGLKRIGMDYKNTPDWGDLF